MSYRNQRPRNRRARRRSLGPTPSPAFSSGRLDLPGPLGLITDRRLFIGVSVVFGVAILLSLVVGVIYSSSPTTAGGPPRQANEAPDVPQEGTVVPGATPQASATVKRYTAPPALTIDPAKRYLATIKTKKGEIQVELYPTEAPQAVNAFVFLAREGYYDGTPFMELVKNTDGSRFYAQAGDPTRTGLGTPGFSLNKETTSRPFVRGAVGMGGAAENSNGGQFFISYADVPALNGKYTIFGQVVSGFEVLDSLALLDLTSGRALGAGDEILSITINEL